MYERILNILIEPSDVLQMQTVSKQQLPDPLDQSDWTEASSCSM